MLGRIKYLQVQVSDTTMSNRNPEAGQQKDLEKKTKLKHDGGTKTFAKAKWQ